MSFENLMERWLECSGTKMVHQTYTLDMNLLKVGATYLGFVYRAFDGRTVVLCGKNMPSAMRKKVHNMTYHRSDVHVRRMGIENLMPIIRAYREFSFNIKCYDEDERIYYVEDTSILAKYLSKLENHDLPPPLDMAKARQTAASAKIDEPAWIAAFENSIPEAIKQLVLVGVLDPDAVGVMYQLFEARGYLARNRFKILETFANKEQRIIARLSAPADALVIESPR